MSILRKIPSTKGLFALVNDEDFEWLNHWKWKINNKGYAIRTGSKINGKSPNIYMSRFIMNCPIDKQVDHIDGNPLNNQRENLRICSLKQNSRNHKLPKNNTSGYKGIRFQSNKWETHISINNKFKYIGRFETKEEAAQAYNEVAIKYYGEFAKLNVV